MNKSCFPVETLRNFMVKALSTAGVAAQEGAIVADNLLTADLQGISSHGIARFPVYLRRLQKGLVNPKPQINVTTLLPAVACIDGDNGLGAVVTLQALETAIALAEKLGIGAAAVRHSNHFGIAGYYSNIGADRGYVTMLVTNGPPAIPPLGGKEAYFGTNPLAIGLPRRTRPHIIVDLATSVAARGKIIQAAKSGQPIPEGWALDKHGNATTDAKLALNGVLLPMAGAKGYALALAIEHLAGVLTGAGFGCDVAWQYGNSENAANVGHLLIVLKLEAFGEIDKYYQQVERFCNEIKNVALAPTASRITLPGEREWHSLEERYQTGIEIDAGLAQELQSIAAEFNLIL